MPSNALEASSQSLASRGKRGSERLLRVLICGRSPSADTGGGAGEPSLEAALLELLAAAARAGIIAADTLERVNTRLGCVGKGQRIIPVPCSAPLLIPLGRIREGVPARELADRVPKRPEPIIPETRHALGIRQGPSKIPAKAIVVHHHRIDQTAPEGLANNAGECLQAEQRYGQHPAAPDKALVLRLQRIVQPEQVGFCLFSSDPSSGREISQHLQSRGAN